jgi:hypothetical protein
MSTPSVQTLVNNEHATLKHYSNTGIIHHTFHQPVSGEQFRNVLDTGYEVIKAGKATKWLSDDRNNMGLSPEDSEWGHNDWFPRMVAAGWKYWAMVVPVDTMARMNLTQFIDSFSAQGIRVHVFTDPKDALIWLENK